MADWYLVFSKPQQERLALENLERQGYTAYLPLARVRRRRGTRFVQAVEAMFPRYLFVALDAGVDDWGPIRSTVGVTSLVRFGDAPARLPAGFVEALRGAEDAEGLQQVAVPDFHPGERVRIAEGAMAGYEAIFKARSARERVVLLLELPGRLARVELDEGDVERR